MVDVSHRDHEPLPLLSLPHDYPQAPLGHVPQLLLLALSAVAVVEEVETAHLLVVVVVGLLPSSHDIILLAGSNRACASR